MNRTDHARGRIDQQDRSAVGGGGADGETLGAGDNGVGVANEGSAKVAVSPRKAALVCMRSTMP